MSDMLSHTPLAALSAAEFADRLLTLRQPTVLMHTRPDGDTVGTAAALCDVLTQLGLSPRYACADPIPDRLAFLLEDEVAATLPDGREGVAVDVASPAQLGTLCDQVHPVLMLDHHRVGTPFAPHFIQPEASSAAEVLLHVVLALVERGRITLTPRLATRLYAGIASDTGSFAYSNTSAATHTAVARLLATGIDHVDIHRRLFSCKTLVQLRAEGYVCSQLQVLAAGRLAYIGIPVEAIAALQVSAEDFVCAVDIARSLGGAQVAVAVKALPDGTYRASLRSQRLNVAAVAERFGGGGHLLAAGCSLTGDTLSAAAAPLLTLLTEQLATDDTTP